MAAPAKPKVIKNIFDFPKKKNVASEYAFQNATTVPENTRILQDINGNDLIVKSDMIKDLSMTNAYLVNDMGMSNLIFNIAINKVEIENKTLAMLTYKIDNFIYVVKISDVDSWLNFGA